MSKLLRKIERKRARERPRKYPWVSQWQRIYHRLRRGWRLVRYTDHQGTRLAKWMRR